MWLLVSPSASLGSHPVAWLMHLAPCCCCTPCKGCTLLLPDPATWGAASQWHKELISLCAPPGLLPPPGLPRPHDPQPLSPLSTGACATPRSAPSKLHRRGTSEGQGSLSRQGSASHDLTISPENSVGGAGSPLFGSGGRRGVRQASMSAVVRTSRRYLRRMGGVGGEGSKVRADGRLEAWSGAADAAAGVRAGTVRSPWLGHWLRNVPSQMGCSRRKAVHLLVTRQQPGLNSHHVPCTHALPHRARAGPPQQPPGSRGSSTSGPTACIAGSPTPGTPCECDLVLGNDEQPMLFRGRTGLHFAPIQLHRPPLPGRPPRRGPEPPPAPAHSRHPHTHTSPASPAGHSPT